MDIRVMWDDDQVVWHSPPYSSSSSFVTADEDDDSNEPLKHQIFKMLVRQSECRYALHFQILEHHKLRYVVVARAELSLESLCQNQGSKSISIPLFKITDTFARDDSTVKPHNPAPLGVRFGTLYLKVTTKLQDQVYNWFWGSLLNHIAHSATLPMPLLASRSPSSSPPPFMNQMAREGLLRSGDEMHDLYDESAYSSLLNESSSSSPLSQSGNHFIPSCVTAEHLKEAIILLGIETSDEAFDEMCTSLQLQPPVIFSSFRTSSPGSTPDMTHGSPERFSSSSPPPQHHPRSLSHSSSHPSSHPSLSPPVLRPQIPIDEFLSHFSHVTPRRPATPHSSDSLATQDLGASGSVVERGETPAQVAALFLGSQLDHDEYIWETALVNDHTRITHLVVGQELRPSAQLLQTADASYDALSSSPPRVTALSSLVASPSTSPPEFSYLNMQGGVSGSPPGGHSLLRSSLSSAYGFFSRFASGTIKERRKDVIFIQDRETGKVVEEKMPQYLRRMLRGMYSNPTGRQLVHQGMSKSLLKRLTFNQAKKYTAAASVAEIPAFISFHNIDASEFLLPVSAYSNFNDFFIRKLKQGVRPIFAPEEQEWAICPADCRLHVYDTLTDAQRLWIKGKTFSLKSLLDNEALEADFAGCSLVIARLAPQDYHRFHYPVSGLSGKYFSQGDAYYTVNPIAVRENVDVYSLNKRTSVIVESPHFGKVMIICIGATMVGSVVLTSGEDVLVTKGDELGYFQFGGSTLLLLFQNDRISFDQDLLFNSAKQQETLVKMGMSLGKARHPPATSSYSA
jgi:phosphatidylserine decarboxylase